MTKKIQWRRKVNHIDTNYTNNNIKVYVFSEAEMRKLGFTDYKKDTWYFRKYLGKDISFCFSINKDRSNWRIDILDEDFLQPYDYQYFINEGNPPALAFEVKSKVDALMQKFVDNGLIENWKVGDYV